MKVNVLYLIKKNNNNKRKTKLSFYFFGHLFIIIIWVLKKSIKRESNNQPHSSWQSVFSNTFSSSRVNLNGGNQSENTFSQNSEQPVM